MCLRTSSTRSWEACSKSCCFAARQKACIQNQKEHINSIKITHNQNRFHGLAAGKQSQTSRDQGPRKCVLARQKLRFPIDEHRTDIKELINASRCSPPTTFIKNTGENTKSKPFKKTIIFRLYDNISVYTINIPSIRQYFRRYEEKCGLGGHCLPHKFRPFNEEALHSISRGANDRGHEPFNCILGLWRPGDLFVHRSKGQLSAFLFHHSNDRRRGRTFTLHFT